MVDSPDRSASRRRRLENNMKIGLQSAFSAATSPQLIADYGRIAEEREFHSLWLPEHVVFFREYASRYPYAARGSGPAPQRVPRLPAASSGLARA